MNGQSKASARMLARIAGPKVGLRELARKAMISPASLSRVVNGRRAATMKTVKALALATGKSVGVMASILTRK